MTIIFPSWHFSQWHAVDDRVRGGSSQSHFDHVAVETSNGARGVGRDEKRSGARFWGTLGMSLPPLPILQMMQASQVDVFVLLPQSTEALTHRYKNARRGWICISKVPIRPYAPLAPPGRIYRRHPPHSIPCSFTCP